MCYSSIGDLLGGRRTEIHVWRLHDAACMAVESEGYRAAESETEWIQRDRDRRRWNIVAAAVIISMSVCCLIHKDLTQIMGSTTA